MSTRDLEQAGLATLEMLTTLIPPPVGPIAGKAIQIARKALESQPDPEAYLDSVRKEIVATAERISSDFSTGR